MIREIIEWFRNLRKHRFTVVCNQCYLAFDTEKQLRECPHKLKRELVRLWDYASKKDYSVKAVIIRDDDGNTKIVSIENYEQKKDKSEKENDNGKTGKKSETR